MINQHLFQHNSASAFAPLPKPADITSQQELAEFAGHVEHQQYHCLLYYWASQLWIKQPKRHSKPLWVVYVEYRDHTRSCRYQPFYFASLPLARQFIRQQVTHCELPNISSKATREFPIKRTH
ncbi:hypothetical protein H0A36_07675 [Endozoicomonas sp. SM1973]|uniref:Uncharacterized protein n=1 Tax=Spartinivicinus marinus TaxID=2994442 RepID=A0A853I7K1_9GAMM|nr:hypothetical protein [Spartinivicinus marinus]MCX4029201.1 hypothetical protein [Spartinivicinus marinus]NYZ65891.1 hypothetical protein [Spartinivicinus marinus]